MPSATSSGLVDTFNEMLIKYKDHKHMVHVDNINPDKVFQGSTLTGGAAQSSPSARWSVARNVASNISSVPAIEAPPAQTYNYLFGRYTNIYNQFLKNEEISLTMSSAR